MTSFDELIGAEPAGAERERLRNVHNLLLEVGPPPELTPAMEAGPTLAMTLSRLRLLPRRRRSFVLAAAAAAFVALIIGLGVSLHGHNSRYPSLALRATGFAPHATGTLELLPAKGSTQPMKLEVRGLPALKPGYVVYLVRNGRTVGSCGSFKVAKANRELTTQLSSPYRARGGDTWVVAVRSGAGGAPGVAVLRATA